jgi:hypothetical protein
MYNTDYLPQLEESRRHLFDNRNPRNLPVSSRYFPPQNIEILECEEDTNGEWVPKKRLEEIASR